MSGPLDYGATHGWKKVDIPVTDYTPATEEEIKEFKELSRELAKIPRVFSLSKTGPAKDQRGGNMSLSDEETISIVRQLSDEEYSKIVEEYRKECSHRPFKRRGEQKLTRKSPGVPLSIPKPREVKKEEKK